MKSKISWKLFFGFSFLISIIFLCLYLYLKPRLQDRVLKDSQVRLKEEISLIVPQVKSLNLTIEDMAGIDAFADRTAKHLQARLTILDQKGIVLGDSELSLAEVKSIESHKSRTEIVEADKSKIGFVMRDSSTLNTKMLYLAYKIPQGYVRLALPLSVIKDGHLAIKDSLLSALVLGLCFGVLVLLVFIRKVSIYMSKLTKFSQNIADGHFGERLKYRSDDERGDIARSFNQMAYSLEKLVKNIERERNYFKNILESINECVLVTDKRGNIALVNKALMDQFSDQPNPIGKTPREFFDQQEIHDCIAKSIELSQVVHHEIHIQEDKTDKVFRLLVSPIGSGLGSVTVFHDITNLRRLENLRRDFVANVSHEFKTPLTSIVGYTETLMSELSDLDETPRKFLKVIDRNAKLLKELVDDVLQLAHIEAGDWSLKIATVDINTSLSDIVESYKRKADQSGVQLKCLCESVPCMIQADEKSIHQIFSNLVDNAIKYSTEGDVVTVEAHDLGDQVAIVVTDTGMGISSEEQTRIFERFYRVDPSRSKIEGTGLGLSIVKHLVLSHEGTISLDSVRGKGSKFTVRLKKVG